MIAAPDTPEELVHRIDILNKAWHALRDLWPGDGDELDMTPSIRGLRETKALLQARLLRDGGGVASLVIDDNPRLSEPCYSVRLVRQLWGRTDAGHMPVRIAERILTAQELTRFTGGR